ncbi:MAG: hypothetical protein JSV65_09875 [Armatimonadota bacterium]|nr:MAG: hypothetical protein JSV65_09875 [Armatimonadota bacterium]
MTRLSVLLALALVLSATCARAVCADDAVVTNGGLEELGDDGFPVDWGPVGEEVTVTSEAHSGQVAFRLLRTPDTAAVETGINRAWEPDSGEQGGMLDRLAGGIVFYYKAISESKPHSLTVQIIPMSARPYEDTGAARVVFAVPENHIADGKWHRGAIRYDFTDQVEAKWVHISPRVLAPGELLLDDFSWVEKVGPIVGIKDIEFTESEEAPGREATISIEVENSGDEPAPTAALTGQAPTGLQLSPAACEVPSLAPGETHRIELTLRGARYEEGVVEVELAAVPEPTAVSLELEGKAAVDRVEVERFIVAPGEGTALRATIANTGRIIIRRVEVAAAAKSAAVRGMAAREIRELAPGRRVTVEWAVTPTAEDPQARVEVTADLPGGAIAEAVGLVCLAAGEPVSLTDGARSLTVYKTSVGYGLCELRAKRETGEAVLAKMPYLGRLAYRTPNGAREERPLYGDTVQRSPHSLIFASTFVDAEGAEWQFGARMRLTAEGRFALSYSLSADQPREVLAFDGPMAYVAEGTGATRHDGLFPGLEWLVEGEESSSDLDLEADHPDRIRYVPHPNKVTIPLMSLRTDDGLVGLLWDPYQKWDGERDRPTAVFASPDRFERRASHLMGLMLPSVPGFVSENEREAERPYALERGRTLTLKAMLLIEPGARDALVAQDAWVEEFGIPEPLPYPHGTAEQEIAFSAQAYLDSLWLPEKKMWLPYKGGPAIWNIPSRNPTYAYDLMIASLLASEAAVREACKERLDLLAAEGPLTPAADDRGFDYGRAEQGLAWQVSVATARMDGQGEDGAWRFDADLRDQGVFKGMDYHELGADDAAELGTCARAAYEILAAARMTGDEQAYAAGVRALKFMERFTVPRAAQVWEVPVHTPDILAAADAVDAYLEAYQIDGDAHWLGEAVRWARGGLPFVYLWNTAEYPFMRYASIPVFGASWLKWSWIGRAVQWNGLRYAHALLKLSECDSTLPWRRIAEGVTVSGMYQQATEPPDIALWPDSISLIDASKSGWIFAPRQVLKNVYYLLGRPEEPETVILRTGDAPIHINSTARISNAAFSGGEVGFTLTYPSAKSGTTAVVGISAPDAVAAGGVAVERVADILATDGPAYSYLPAMSTLCIRITRDGSHQVEIAGVSPRSADLLPEPRAEIAFEFDATSEGWLPVNELSPFQVARGMLATEAMGGDPYMNRSRMQVNGDSVSAVVVRMAITGGDNAQFYWGTQDAPGFSEERVVRFPITADGQFHEYRIGVGGHPQWTGHRIVAIRLDPNNGASGARVQIDWIRGE